MHESENLDHPGGATTSIWHATSTVPTYPPLTADTTADVCVVGAGIAGLTTAYMLAKAGKSVVVLDDGPIGGGETGRTTAHLTAAMDDRIHVLEGVHGEEGARRIVASHMAAVNRIEQIVTMEGIDCDFRRVDGYLFAARPRDAEELDQELDAARRAGFADARRTNDVPIPALTGTPTLVFPEQAQFHPLRYIIGLAAAIIRLGGRIHCGSHVKEVLGGPVCHVRTDDGVSVRADAVCVCTNGSISDYVQTHTKQAPYRTYVVAMRVPRGTVTPGLYWDTANPYHYVRLQPLDDADQGVSRGETLWDALIVGGEDHKTAHDDDADARWARLVTWTRQHWPEAREVITRWSGQVLEPNDFVAFIGRNPDGAENVYMASGDSGQGMTHGTIAGMLLTDLITGKENPWETIYDPRRISLRAASLFEMAKENLDVAKEYVTDWLRPGEVAGTEEIPRGEGRVIRKGVHKVAAYCDQSGTVHELNAACTHLRCIVGWNSAEESWDCPCHGSRFDPYGKVLNGPAIADLEPHG